LSIVRQCDPLGLSRSSFYYRAKGESRCKLPGKLSHFAWQLTFQKVGTWRGKKTQGQNKQAAYEG
jgi:hypothetical protein